EMFEGGRGVAAAAGVDGGGLDYSAARGDEPMEPLALRKLADRSGVIATATDRWNRRQMLSHQLQINRRIERQQSRLIQLDPRLQKRQLRTRDDHARVNKLLAVHFRYDPNYSIVIPEFTGHESPPRRSCEAPRDASLGNRRKLACFPQSY